MNKIRKRNIRFIEDNINDILIEDRVFILNMICEKLGRHELFEEGTGIRLRYSILNDDLLIKIKKYIIESKKKTQLIL